jgi:hypothetical protein
MTEFGHVKGNFVHVTRPSRQIRFFHEPNYTAKRQVSDFNDFIFLLLGRLKKMGASDAIYWISCRTTLKAFHRDQGCALTDING